VVAQKLQAFCSEDLGAFYLDVLKDRLYTCGADSAARRSAQTALWHITNSLVRLIAPVLSFTAEELWQEFARAGDDSVFFHTWHEVPVPPNAPGLLAKWTRLRELRAPVRKEVEALRAGGKVGSSLQAEVEVAAPAADYDLLASLGSELKFLMITSLARAVRGDALAAKVAASGNAKCERCWHYMPDVNGEGLCGRCQTNVRGAGEKRTHV